MLEKPTTGNKITAASKLFRGLLARAKAMGTAVFPATYGEANEQYVKMPSITNRKLGEVLDIVHEGCVQNGLPDLAALCVRADTRRPGDRYCLLPTWEQELEKIRNYPWASIDPDDMVVATRVKL